MLTRAWRRSNTNNRYSDIFWYLIRCTVIIHWKCTFGICPVDEVFICFSAQQTYHWHSLCNESQTMLQITIKRHFLQSNYFDNLLTKVSFPDMRNEWWWCWQRRRRYIYYDEVFVCLSRKMSTFLKGLSVCLSVCNVLYSLPQK